MAASTLYATLTAALGVAHHSAGRHCWASGHPRPHVDIQDIVFIEDRGAGDVDLSGDELGRSIRDGLCSA